MNDTEHHSTQGDPLDALLHAHLRGELDGQLGRAEARFSRELKGAAAAAPGRRGVQRLAIWGLWAAAASAASVGIVWGVAVHRIAPPARLTGPVSPQVVETASAQPEPVGEVVEFSTVDEGTLVLENEGPARQLRRQVVQTTQWYDPQTGGRFEISVPEEQVVLIGLPSY